MVIQLTSSSARPDTPPGRDTGYRWCLLAAGLLLLAGCQNLGPGPVEPTSSSPVPSASAPAPTDTQVSLNLTTLTPTVVPDLPPTPTVIPSTPEFSLPAANQRSLPAWRPPSYPVPWVPSPFDHFYFTQPIGALDIDSAFNTYGYGGVFFENVVHTGIDIPGDIGTPILAAGGGRVVYAGQGVYRGGNNILDDPYGKAVVIKHDFNYRGEPLYTLYAHMDEILVSNSQVVQAGEQIGRMGNTGRTTGPHLHFELRLGKNEYFSSRNPDLWISPPQGWGIVVGQVLDYVGRPLESQIVYLRPGDDNPHQGPVEDVGWIGYSYQNEAVNTDPYYRENFTLANIPAGRYILEVRTTSIGYIYSREIEVLPGQVTFFKFNLWKGFSDQIPPTPEDLFSPSP